MRFLLLSITVFSTLLVPLGPVRAQSQENLLFDVRLYGLKAGEFSISAKAGAKQYAATSRFVTTGLVKALKRLRADVAATGRISAKGPRPANYSESIDDGKRVTDVKVRFGGGAPRLLSGNPDSKAPPADTSKLRGALDPLTALYQVLRDHPTDWACDFGAAVYDGHRHARLTLSTPRKTKDTLICTGTYSRIDGYTASELERQNVPIVIKYTAKGDVWQSARVEVETRRGRAVMVRR